MLEETLLVCKPGKGESHLPKTEAPEILLPLRAMQVPPLHVCSFVSTLILLFKQKTHS